MGFAMKVAIPLLLWVLGLTQVALASIAAQRLHSDLFKMYNKQVRPVVTESKAVNVTIGMSLQKLMNLDEGKQILTISVWMRHYWTDPMLSWDSDKYDGISVISVNPKSIWMPDITLYNNAGASSGSMEHINTKVSVNSNGKCVWHAPIILKSTCRLDLKHFPFDEQECKLTFGSWTYDGSRLALLLEKIKPHTDYYSEDSEWHLKDVSAERRVVHFVCCPEGFHDIVFSIKLQRKSKFYVANLIVPMAIIQMLTVISFLLPAESGERISLSTTLLLSMVVLMLFISNTVPKTSEITPLLGVFFSTAMIEMVVMILVLCYTSRLYHKGLLDPAMPLWMRRHILEGLAYKLGIRERKGNMNGNYAQEPHSIGYTVDSQSDQQASNDEGLLIPQSPLYPKMEEDKPSDQFLANGGQTSSNDGILRLFAVIKDNANRDQVEKRIKAEWRIVGNTLDRCLLIVFLLVVSLTILIFFA